MASATVEDYLKHIYLAGTPSGSGQVPMGRLAEALDVTPGTVTTMVKSLAANRLVLYEPYRGVTLTRRGRRLAASMVRRHRLVELFLVEVLGMDWAEVHEDAERLEHAISDRLLARLDDYLGHPVTDPHGDPIPDRHGAIERKQRHTLMDCAPGARVQLERIVDQRPEFLRSLDRHGLRPGRRLRIVERDDVAGTILVRAQRKPALSLGQTAARRILVRGA